MKVFSGYTKISISIYLSFFLFTHSVLENLINSKYRENIFIPETYSEVPTELKKYTRIVHHYFIEFKQIDGSSHFIQEATGYN